MSKRVGLRHISSVSARPPVVLLNPAWAYVNTVGEIWSIELGGYVRTVGEVWDVELGAYVNTVGKIWDTERGGYADRE